MTIFFFPATVQPRIHGFDRFKGRGKSMVADATISAAVVQTILKTTVDALVRLGQAKLLIGSSMAGTIGGWNAHAANIVAAIFIATGQVWFIDSVCLSFLPVTFPKALVIKIIWLILALQDVAQVVSSSMCLTVMEKTELGDLYISCSMRCLEVGTVGGGTILPAQTACLQVC